MTVRHLRRTWPDAVEQGAAGTRHANCCDAPVVWCGEILDPSRGSTATRPWRFLGSGTTVIAAETLGRCCLGMEIDPKYCQIAIERWQNFTGRTAEHLDG